MEGTNLGSVPASLFLLRREGGGGLGRPGGLLVNRGEHINHSYKILYKTEGGRGVGFRMGGQIFYGWGFLF